MNGTYHYVAPAGLSGPQSRLNAIEGSSDHALIHHRWEGNEQIDIWRVDFSLILSKYPGELAAVMDFVRNTSITSITW